MHYNRCNVLVKVNQDGLKLYGTHQLLVYAPDVNILGGVVHNVKKNREALVVASKESRLEVNADKLSTCSCLETRMQDEFTIQGLITLPLRGWKSSNFWEQEEIKCRMKSGNACYHSVHNLLSSNLLSQNIKFKIYRTLTLPFVLYGCNIWSVTLREERRLSVFENRALKGIFEPKRDKVTGELSKLRNEELNDLYCSPNIVLVIKSRRFRLGGM